VEHKYATKKNKSLKKDQMPTCGDEGTIQISLDIMGAIKDVFDSEYHSRK
jgi:NifU-like protein involved in Fe-S cluster formation